jgi:enamine deaminase RidA (YjgF/YER057c/UK114 family)
MNGINQKLIALGITLPTPTKPVANYVPWLRSGNLIFISGQLPLADGKPTQQGQILTVSEGAIAAKQCAINILAQLREACDGDLDRVQRVVKLVGFVNTANADVNIPQVVNGASDLMVEVFGENGKHARSAVGVAQLPLNLGVEIEAIVEII